MWQQYALTNWNFKIVELLLQKWQFLNRLKVCIIWIIYIYHYFHLSKSYWFKLFNSLRGERMVIISQQMASLNSLRVIARLDCSINADYPFFYDEIQSAYYLESEGLIYATFSTPENSILGSAICSFNIADIEEIFQGPFKRQIQFGKLFKM